MNTVASLEAVLLKPIVFTHPIRLVSPSSWVPHIPFAFWLVDALRPHTLVELGTQSGNSYSALAQAVQMAGLDTSCTAIDTWQGDPQSGFYDDSVFAEWSQFHSRHFGGFSRLIRLTFDQATALVADRSVDLLHLDGRHTYQSARHDFETWLPKLSNRSIVLFHAINAREREAGVWKLWTEVQQAYPGFAFAHGSGLGVAAIGTDLPPAVRWLVSELPRDAAQTALVRRFFSALGTALEQCCEATPVTPGDTRATRARTSAAANVPGREAESDLEDDDSARLTLRADNAQLRSALSQVELDRLSAESELTSLRTKLALLEREQVKTQAALAIASRELAAIRKSRSWRLTAPFRSTKRIGWQPLTHLTKPRAAVAMASLLARPRKLAELRRVATSGLLDEAFYLRENPDVRSSGVPAAIHYVKAGAREGRAPNALFDGRFYYERNPDVREAIANPLVHYVVKGAAERRDPHALFSTAYYLRQHPEIEASGENPLQHFLSGTEGPDDSPHPLFDARFYRAQNEDVRRSGQNALVHFIETGARRGAAPHALFDTTFYLRRNPDVRAQNVNPLVHYLEHVPGEDRDPHPLFDSSYYLAHSPDVALRGINPLLHFIEHGWQEGRRPNPGFDPRWYLEMNPDVAEQGQNPLEHFVTFGWREERDPSPEFSTSAYLAQYPDVAARNEPALIHYLEHGRREGRVATTVVEPPRLEVPRPVTLRVRGSAADLPRTSAPTVVCLSHAVPWPPRAGNEYRISRLLQSLRGEGFRVVLVIAPLPGESVDESHLDVLAEKFGNVVQCHRNGEIQFRFDECADVLSPLDGRRTSNFASLLGEPRAVQGTERRLLIADRTYCHDPAIETTLRLQDALRPVALMCEYVWMSRLLPLVDGHTLRIIDSHDVISDRRHKVLAMGFEGLEVSPAQEAKRLARADLVLAIQEEEARQLKALVPETPVITVGVDFNVAAARSRAERPIVLAVGSGNKENRAGLLDFLHFAWPRVKLQVPDAKLVVVGGMGTEIPENVPDVEAAGGVDDLAPIYASARVVINPTVAGTGLKIKTVEALSHFRPVVTWPSGFEGIPQSLRTLMRPAGDWIEFADRVVDHLRATTSAFDDASEAAIRQFLSPATAYGELIARLREKSGHR